IALPNRALFRSRRLRYAPPQRRCPRRALACGPARAGAPIMGRRSVVIFAVLSARSHGIPPSRVRLSSSHAHVTRSPGVGTGEKDGDEQQANLVLAKRAVFPAIGPCGRSCRGIPPNKRREMGGESAATPHYAIMAIARAPSQPRRACL